MKKTLADSADKQFENYDFWRNDVEMLDYWTTGPDYFRTKARKGNPSDGGIIGYETKGLLRFNNVISSLMGQKTLMAFLVGLNDMQKKNTHWYNDNHVLNDWIGMLSPKCYFTEPQK